MTMQRKCKRAQSQACLNYAECSLSSNDSAKEVQTSAESSLLNYAECSLSSNDSAKVLQISDTAKNRPAEFC